MPEPVTPNIGLIVPNTGDLPGAWGTSAVNPNMSAIDGLFGGTVTLSLAAATTITLTSSTAVLTPGGGPFQQNNACIFFTGTNLSGNAIVKFTQPGRYVVNNQLPSGVNQSYYVQLAPSTGTGLTVGAPAGQKVTVFYDGTNVDYVDSPPVGAMFWFGLGVDSNSPAWWSACTVTPYLRCDHTLYNFTQYTALANLLGSTFGGDGASTFRVPSSNTAIIAGGNALVFIKT
jgi:hypothetical protein